MALSKVNFVSFSDVPSCSNVQRLFRKINSSTIREDTGIPFHRHRGIKQGLLMNVV